MCLGRRPYLLCRIVFVVFCYAPLTVTEIEEVGNIRCDKGVYLSACISPPCAYNQSRRTSNGAQAFPLPGTRTPYTAKLYSACIPLLFCMHLTLQHQSQIIRATPRTGAMILVSRCLELRLPHVSITVSLALPSCTERHPSPAIPRMSITTVSLSTFEPKRTHSRNAIPWPKVAFLLKHTIYVASCHHTIKGAYHRHF